MAIIIRVAGGQAMIITIEPDDALGASHSGDDHRDQRYPNSFCSHKDDRNRAFTSGTEDCLRLVLNLFPDRLRNESLRIPPTHHLSFP
ncbi:hypothetical protein KIN20_030534 [Parelaphostrongylus tenuis]|uniref:Uncharacterized protein n=1 Tax=Parelaphostrongylus tenuis TaxID=148309 RepID=A0AAD5R3V9_PARTN|nr:hypothetical protein KIN20_030534 [Parelaphostrongylus tenuis]